MTARQARTARFYQRHHLALLRDYVAMACCELEEMQMGRPGDVKHFMARVRDCARAAERAGYVFTG